MSELKTCFKRVDYDLDGLLHFIDLGDIALPDIQRPFVWKNSKVRDLFDPMYRGFPPTACHTDERDSQSLQIPSADGRQPFPAGRSGAVLNVATLSRGWFCTGVRDNGYFTKQAICHHLLAQGLKPVIVDGQQQTCNRYVQVGASDLDGRAK
jgi:hypothetical protein